MVVSARNLIEQVVAASPHPVGRDIACQPLAPGDLQGAFNREVQAGQDHAGKKEQEQEPALPHQARPGMLLQGIEEARVPLGEQYSHGHLQHSEEGQKNHSAPDFHALLRIPELPGQMEKFSEKGAGLRHSFSRGDGDCIVFVPIPYQSALFLLASGNTYQSMPLYVRVVFSLSPSS